MNNHLSNKENQVLDQAEIVMNERGYTNVKRYRNHIDENGNRCNYIIAQDGDKFIYAFPRNTRAGMTYSIG